MLKDFSLGEHLLLVGNQGVGKNKIIDRYVSTHIIEKCIFSSFWTKYKFLYATFSFFWLVLFIGDLESVLVEGML